MSKLTYEDKINLYTDKKKGLSIEGLSNKYKVSKNVINYLTALIDKHGIEILRTKKNKIHIKFEKQEAIDDYINYYNYDRIKVKLKGLSPVNYRLQSFN